jgi:predicted lipoprotein with Yx(FWY)xxD motif
VAPMKRTIILAAALAALTACAPAGYSADSGDTEQVANAAAAAEATPTPSAEAPAPPKAVNLTEQLVSKKIDKMGQVVTDQKGWVLYRFDRDSANPPTSNCAGDCARVWPPALTDGQPQLQGVSDDKVGTVDRADGTRQLTLAGWPLYRYIGDPKPGAWKGQGVGGTWFVVAPDGKKNLTCLPTGTPKPVTPPPLDGAPAAPAGGSSY